MYTDIIILKSGAKLHKNFVGTHTCVRLCNMQMAVAGTHTCVRSWQLAVGSRQLAVGEI